jgi:uncharacterized protein DUF416
VAKPRPRLNSIDDYEQHLATTLEHSSPAHRTAFAAAMADRWLHVYTAFARREEWGDPDALRASVDAVWAHIGGRPLSAGDRARHLGLVRESTPHMDDFDAPEALAVAVMVQGAVSSCAADNLGPAMQSGLSAFQAIVPDWDLEPDEQPRIWERKPIRKELEKQLKLLDRLTSMPRFDSGVSELRAELARPELAGEIPRRAAPSAPALRTNQDIFEQYRAIIELEAKTRREWTMPDADPATLAMLWFTEWLGRYKRRRDLLSGTYGKLADEVGQQALVRRQQAKDRVVSEIPAWNPDARQMIDLCLANPMLGVDVTSVDAPHGYGPSIRRLWAEALGEGKSEREAWQHVTAWVRHRPAAWEEEDHRKRKGLAFSTSALVEHLAREITWNSTSDPENPWSVELDGARWQVRLNDFPDEIMYSLIVDANEIGQFHDWPEGWRR